MALVNLPLPSAAELYSEVIGKIVNLFSAVRDNIYPVGSIYMSTRPTNPSNFIGGTWEAINDRYLVGVGADHPKAGDVGGAKTHKHMLPVGWDESSGMFAYNKDTEGTPKFGSTVIERGNSYTWPVVWKHEMNWLRVADSDEASSEPPYYPVYIWTRVA